MSSEEKKKQMDVHRVEDSYRRAYLTGEKSLKWMIGIIRSSSLRGSELLDALSRMDDAIPKDEGTKKRAEVLRKELERLGSVN